MQPKKVAGATDEEHGQSADGMSLYLAGNNASSAIVPVAAGSFPLDVKYPNLADVCRHTVLVRIWEPLVKADAS